MTTVALLKKKASQTLGQIHRGAKDMEKLFNRFVSEDAGTIETDWLTLIVGVLMLAGAVLGTFASGSNDVAHVETPSEQISAL
ncbi:hypothetical protein [Rhodalgimonas zhirmunskyi]|uniref:Uncharacterized protein n=1 Tax=Rhodalgimonas zhirmunskyi TaxID=2964767 RepID=A0AAJ1UA82_9RHOB|nr:hypothetical protein [Rhodoalgimonas zhirmunskyi]MDQ2095660.1 hypothetical protein [Rhodoalgimonas zhirmunskyi]